MQNFYAIWDRTEGEGERSKRKGEGGKDKMAEPYTEVVAVALRVAFLELQANLAGQGNCQFQALRHTVDNQSFGSGLYLEPEERWLLVD